MLIAITRSGLREEEEENKNKKFFKKNKSEHIMLYGVTKELFCTTDRLKKSFRKKSNKIILFTIMDFFWEGFFLSCGFGAAIWQII